MAFWRGQSLGRLAEAGIQNKKIILFLPRNMEEYSTVCSLST
jgi:hypothetical protein